ncbi:MAG: family 16 glycoside hydrolase [Akkermansiaceae bacterium]
MTVPITKSKALLLLGVFLGSPLSLAQEEKLLFEDHFERKEADDTKEEIGNGWSSNSQKRAKGNKQVDLKDGAMHITFHPEADHAVSVVHPAEFQNGKITLRFMLPNKEDSLGLNFADLKYKKVHAGHLCMAKIDTHAVQLNDLKTGVMDQEIRVARQAKKLTPEQQKMLKTKTKRFKNKIEPGKWHRLEITIIDDTMALSINGVQVGAFSSEGIAHPTKRTLRVAVPKKAIIDDIKVYALK